MDSDHTSIPARVAGSIARLVYVVPRWVAMLVAATSCLWASGAKASPWVLEKGVFAVGLSAGAGLASSEFLPDGRNQAFPLRGRFDSYFVQLDTRAGVGNGFEVTFKTLVKGVSYQADPVILTDKGPQNSLTLNDARQGVFNFSRRALGLADLYLGAVYQHYRGSVIVASSVELKLPSGYVGPKETFRDRSPLPGQVADDVALGDAQVDLQYMLELGWVIQRTRTFFALNLGYRARFNGPGHQALGEVKVGQAIGKRVFVFATAETALTLFDGEVIGTTFVAKDPLQPADRFELSNLETLNLRLDRSFVSVGGGVILRAGGNEWVASASRVVWGRNYSELTQFSLGVIVPFR